MKPRKCDIVELAVWLHDTAMSQEYYDHIRDQDLSFSSMCKDKQDVYKFVAKELLTNPPVFLKEAL